MSWSRAIHEKISEAIAEGSLDLPKSMLGTRLNLDSYFSTPAHLRMGYSVLASSGFTPLEVGILKEMNNLEKRIERESEERRVEELKMQFNSLAVQLDVKTRLF